MGSSGGTQSRSGDGLAKHAPLSVVALGLLTAVVAAAAGLAFWQQAPGWDDRWFPVSELQALLVAAVGAYALVFSLARDVMVARPKAIAIRTEHRNLCTELEVSKIDPFERLRLKRLLDLEPGTTWRGSPPAPLKFQWLWNGEAELDVAMRLAAVRRLLADALVTDPRLRPCQREERDKRCGRKSGQRGGEAERGGGSGERLGDAYVRSTLRAMLVPGRSNPTPERKAEIKEALVEGQGGQERRRALLRALRDDEIEAELTTYRLMLTLYRKNWWLVAVALGTVLAVGLSSEALLMPLLAGVVGGVLITFLRLTRTSPDRAAFDTRWVVITLAVPIGALGGAAAVVLVAGLAELEVIGGTFRDLQEWFNTDGDEVGWPIVASVAFVGGFSARFIERLAQRLDASTDTSPPTASRT